MKKRNKYRKAFIDIVQRPGEYSYVEAGTIVSGDIIKIDGYLRRIHTVRECNGIVRFFYTGCGGISVNRFAEELVAKAN